jgi:hypothetical protein
MADVIKNASPFTIDGVNQYIMGGDSTGQVSILTIHILSNTATGSMTVTARKAGSGLAFVQIPYKKRWLNGAVGDDTNVTTAITGTSIIEVNAAGLDVALNVSALSAGSFTVHYSWNIG